jgi:hypothetical protein
MTSWEFTDTDLSRANAKAQDWINGRAGAYSWRVKVDGITDRHQSAFYTAG